MMNKVLVAMVLVLIIGLAGTVVLLSATIAGMHDEIEDVRGEISGVQADLHEHVKSALYYMRQFNDMRERAERANSSRVARQVEGIDGD